MAHRSKPLHWQANEPEPFAPLIRAQVRPILGTLAHMRQSEVPLEACPHCSTSWATVAASSLVGCPLCYVVFRHRLEAEFNVVLA